MVDGSWMGVWRSLLSHSSLACRSKSKWALRENRLLDWESVCSYDWVTTPTLGWEGWIGGGEFSIKDLFSVSSGGALEFMLVCWLLFVLLNMVVLSSIRVSEIDMIGSHCLSSYMCLGWRYASRMTLSDRDNDLTHYLIRIRGKYGYYCRQLWVHFTVPAGTRYQVVRWPALAKGAHYTRALQIWYSTLGRVSPLSSLDMTESTRLLSVHCMRACIPL